MSDILAELRYGKDHLNYDGPDGNTWVLQEIGYA